MSVFTRIFGNKRSTASILTIALIAGVPVTFAVLHPGFPVSDVKLTSRDVWTTNAQDLLAGRLNRQINALNGSVRTASASFDVLQDGDTVFLADQVNSTLQRIDPSFTTLADSVALPAGAELSYGGNTLAIVNPSDGKLWIVGASGRMQFDASTTEPNMKLGTGAHATVTAEGTVLAASSGGTLYRFASDGSQPEKHTIPKLSSFQISAVGEHAVMLDTSDNKLVREDGSTVDLPKKGVRLQQTGKDNSFALVATSNSLLNVPLSGTNVTEVPINVDVPLSSTGSVAAPVFLDGCAHGAWADAQRYLQVCTGKSPNTVDIPQQTAGNKLEFRVNRHVIVLNNLNNGNAWVLNPSSLQLVNNWNEVAPPPDNKSKDGNQNATKQSFQDTLAKRTKKNHPPTVVDDTFGVRPGTTTILPVLDNDSDVDGDVLTITGVSDVPSSVGVVQVIDSGRALQFTSAAGAIGGTSFRYTVSDGRPGGIAEGTVTLSVHPMSTNQAPIAKRLGAVIVESGQSVTYNVLADWMDPDGDDLQLVAASSKSGDIVRFTPDGFVTFQHTSSEIGIKQVVFTVSDGKLTTQGTLTVDVKAAGTLNPIGTPDFATGFVGDDISIAPLKNDKSPSGKPLTLLSVEPLEGAGTITPNLDRGTVVFRANSAGTYYLQYTVGAGAKTSIGIIRVDVVPNPDKPLKPIAVRDVAYLRDNQPTLVPVLDNDISPSGAVLAIQTVTPPDNIQGLSIEILSSTVLRVTSAAPLSEQVHFSYTMSDGTNSSSAGVTLVPVAPLVKHQSPIAVDDNVTVRAGDIASVDVLANDFHPDGVAMALDPVLADPGVSGLAFVSGDRVRFQAPMVPGQYSVVYRVVDAFKESAVGRVTFTVTAPDQQNNRAPLPVPIVARGFSDAAIPVHIPLDGIDPDGDSVTLVAFPKGPQLGDIVAQGSDSFVYKPYPGSTGTDSFTYQVIDAYGATAIGSIQIGVIKRGDSSLPPVAVNDAISLKPNRVASVDVLANDSDPNGYDIKIDPTALVVPKGIKASVVDNRVVVEAPATEGPFAINYTLTNGHGGTATAVLNVTVSKDAPPQYPTAIDHLLQAKDIVGKSTVPVNVYEGAQNPGGLIKDLTVAVLGPNAAHAVVKSNGSVEVKPSSTRMAIAYSLTNEIDNLTSTAFIIVPPAPKPGFADPPIIKPGLAPQSMNVNETKSWQLKDIVFVPSGHPALLTGKDNVSAKPSNGDPIYQDATTLTFTPKKDFRGPASIQFEVTDGSSPGDPNGNKAILTLNITVGDPNFEDVSPTFTPPSVNVEADGTAAVDLHQSTSHPNPKVIAAIQYSGLSGQTNNVGAQLSGSTLNLSAPRNAKIGSIVVINFTLTFKGFTVPGSVKATVVSSLKPRAQAVTDAVHAVRNVVTVVHPLDNDVNPFPDTPLQIIDAKLENPASGAGLSFTSSTITVTPGPSFIGDVSIVYTVRDATNDDTRNVTGRVIVTVWDVPDRQAAPTISGWGDGTVTVQFSPPPSINGSAVTSYTVRSQPAVAAPTCSAGAACTFTGLANGTPYQFFVVAKNEVGSSQESSASATATPYRQPGAPSSANISASGYAPASLNMSWGAPGDTGGGNLSYEWGLTLGSGETGATRPIDPRVASVGGKPAGTYEFHVRACNPAGCGAWTPSSPAVVLDPPPPPTSVTLSQGALNTTTTTAHYFHIEARAFTPNQPFSVGCFANGGSFATTTTNWKGTTNLRFDGSGNFSGDVGCWEGFHQQNYAVINGVQSNTTSW